ncbi:MAG: alpha/beta hydrolase [Pseudomonadota bacterium]
MKITKDMWDEELRPLYGSLSFVRQLVKRRWTLSIIDFLTRRFLIGKPIEGVLTSEHKVSSRDDGHKIRVNVHRPDGSSPGETLPLMLYIHGGGYITGIPEIFNESIKCFIDTRPCVVVAPDYRKAYTKPYPTALNDCYDTLHWAIENANQIGVDPTKIMVVGTSAGGGLTAALSLKARDAGEYKIAFQMPIYPMIDDQQPDDPERHMHSPGWDSELNRIGWSAYLADLHRTGEDIPPDAAPMRCSDYAGLPPTITLVGTLEPFYWETVRYVDQLSKAGVAVAFREFDKCFHGFDFAAGETKIGKEALDFTYSNYADYYDRYVA